MPPLVESERPAPSHSSQQDHDTADVTTRADAPTSWVDRALTAGFVMMALLYVTGMWQVIDLRDPAGGVTSFETAFWAGVAASAVVGTVLLFFVRAYRASQDA